MERSLTELRDAYLAEADLFDAALEASKYVDIFAAFRAHEAGEEWPPELESAYQKYSAALWAFYTARDGERGFLGKYGL